jgi:hypothetical protein
LRHRFSGVLWQCLRLRKTHLYPRARGMIKFLKWKVHLPGVKRAVTVGEVPIASDLATFKIPTPFAPCCRTFRSVALSIFGRPSFTPWTTAHRCQKVTLSDFKSSDGREPRFNLSRGSRCQL